MKPAPDPAILAAVRQVLAEAGLIPTTAAAPCPSPPPSPMVQHTRAPQLACYRCGFEASRTEAKDWKWSRTPDGWLCHLHSPIDFPLTMDLTNLLGGTADDLIALLGADGEKDVAGILDAVDHAAHLLEQIQKTVEPMRGKTAT